ncbi:apolipoprotein N-acyltransferase [Paraconexibacter sp.]|uniref:apolipoprotein N-acyltransferase n=1 Tax=Paraconexibacter sp. TaxID=2949640 RepID=UPI003564740A
MSVAAPPRSRVAPAVGARDPASARPPLAIAALGGVVMAMALPPLDLLPAVPVGLVLLALALRDAPTARAAALRAGVWAAAGGLIGLRFVVPTVERFSGLGVPGGLVALVGLALLQSAGWSVGAALAHLARTRLGAPFAVAFGVTCLVGCSAPGVFTWTPAGLLAPRPELVQLAEFGGERGVSVLLAVLAALAVSGRPRRPAIAMSLVAVVLLGAVDRLGAWRMDAVEARAGAGRVTVGLVDPGAPARRTVRTEEQVARVARLRELSASADGAGAAFVVWPESAYPVALPRAARTLGGGSVSPVGPDATTPRIIGLRTVERGPARTRQYNSATVVTPDGRLTRPVDKRRLLWLGETVPLFDAVPPLASLFPGARRVTPGDRPRALSVPVAGRATPVRTGVLICYEDVDPAPARAVARDLRPQLLVNLTNDAWFAGTSAPELQARLSALRAVETRTALVRAVNAGGGGWVDAAGRRRAVRRVRGGSVVLASPRLRSVSAPATTYARFGDLPLWALVALALGASAVWRRRVHGLALSPRECQ